MSRRDRTHKFDDSPDFKEIPSITSAQIISGNKPSAAPAVQSVTISIDEAQEGNSGGIFCTITSFFYNFIAKAVNLSAICSKSLFFAPWNCFRSITGNVWGVLKKIPSYCVIHWDADGEVEHKTTLSAPNIKPAISNAPLSKTPTKADPIKTGNSLEPKTKIASAGDSFDEDFAPLSRWWGFSIKSAAAVAAVLVLIGGFFFIKPQLLKTSPEGTETETAAPTEIASTKESTPAAQPNFSAPVSENISENISGNITIPAADDTWASSSQAQNVPVQHNSEPVSAPDSVSSSSAPAVADSFVSPAQSGPTIAEVASIPPQPPLEPAPASVPVSDPFSFPPMSSAPSSDPFASAPLAAVSEQPPAAEIAAAPLNIPSNIPLNAQLDVPQPSVEPPQTSLTALQPIESAPMTLNDMSLSDLAPLQPLTAQISPAVPAPAFTAQAAPAAAWASANAPVASNFKDRRNARRTAKTNAQFGQAPNPPAVVSTIPPGSISASPAPPSVPAAEPVREIVPQIPHSGNVQNIPPPISQPAVVTSTPINIPGESAPAIPEDSIRINAQNSDSPATITEDSVTQFLPMTEPPIDRQLREQLREMRDDTPEPAKLRFTRSAPATSEPALRFTPKKKQPNNAAPDNSDTQNNEGNLLMESADQLQNLMPPNPSDTLSPNSEAIALALPALENAPEPVVAQIRPAYHQEQNTGIASETAAVRYIVQEGDTIFRLATDRLQDTTRWKEIYALNTDRIHNVRDLTPGMEILLPAETAQAARQLR